MGLRSLVLARLNKITTLQAVLIIAVVGLVVYFSGLATPFQGDDIPLIVNNVPVHSIANILQFFEHNMFSFTNAQGVAPFIGFYYRPVMLVFFSLIYTLFGPHAIYFHVFQLMLYIGSTVILYLFFRYSFKPVLALFLSLVFLVHPINSQDVFSIAASQEVLFFFFGILALWLLIRYKSIKSLLLVAACLFASLLSKETGILFVVMALTYVFWWNRERLYAFAGIMVLPVALWLALKIHVVGLNTNPHLAPIDNLSLAGRLLSTPAIMLLYITKLIFPWKLATAYFWVYPTFSFRHFVLPLVIDLAVVALVAYLAVLIRRKATKAQFFTYIFFVAWCGVGLISLIPIIPLDMTASERYFIFPMVGVLGMIGVILTVFKPRISPRWLLVIAVVVISVLGLRTALRGLDYRTQYALTRQDIAASPQDFNAYNFMSSSLYSQGDYQAAQTYAQRSIAVFPTPVGYEYLGVALIGQGDYAGGEQAFVQGLHYGNFDPLYDNLGALIVAYGGNQTSDQQFLLNALKHFPKDPDLWSDLAIFEARHGNNAVAKVAISNAASYGQVNQAIYNSIMNNKSLTVNLPEFRKNITIP